MGDRSWTAILVVALLLLVETTVRFLLEPVGDFSSIANSGMCQ